MPAPGLPWSLVELGYVPGVCYIPVGCLPPRVRLRTAPELRMLESTSKVVAFSMAEFTWALPTMRLCLCEEGLLVSDWRSCPYKPFEP